jgi:hypothetical protein
LKDWGHAKKSGTMLITRKKKMFKYIVNRYMVYHVYLDKSIVINGYLVYLPYKATRNWKKFKGQKKKSSNTKNKSYSN